MTFQKGESVKLIAKHTGKVLGTGKVGHVDERKLSIHHEGGAVTMVQMPNDICFRVQAA